MKIKEPMIIIAEDDGDDRLLIQDALTDNGIADRQIVFVNNGDELIKMLYKQIDRHCLVLLDLNMPKKDGRQALIEIKNDSFIKHVPLIVFTTSRSEDDISLAYKYGGNTYFTKPSLYSDLVEIVGVIKKYWLEKASMVAV